jgi:hypothetical protein
MEHKKTVLTVRELDPEAAISFIRAYHYSKVLPRLCRHFLGFYKAGELSGVVALSWGTQPLQTIRKIFPRHSLLTADYLEIGKMCFLPEENGNGYFGSLALSALIGWLRSNTDCLFLYTLADGIEGKCGYVYQAANFRYLGSFTTSVYRDAATGEKIHPRSAGALLAENAALDHVQRRHWLTHDFCAMKGIEKINGRMFRYIYPLTKQARELLDSYPEYAAIPYPKNRDLSFSVRTGHRQYEQIPPPRFNRDICNYNPQKYGIERRATP